MKAQIITIGDEILIGQVIDTNSAWLASELNQLGIAVDTILSISDTREAIHQTLCGVPKDVRIVIMTGGLGPTKDDITKAALAAWFESDWKTDERVVERVKQHFAGRGIPVPETSLSQARVPSNCDVLFNAFGSAPGMWFEKNNKVFISMPGVPYEMKHIFSERAVPRIRERLQQHQIVHRTVLTQGIGESSLMELINEWEDGLAEDNIKLAYLPSPGAVRLRLSAVSKPEANSLARIDAQVDRLLPIISDYTFGFQNDTLPIVLGRLLRKFGYSVSTAESCTGGYIAHMITSVSGSSQYFYGSAVTYSNRAKERVLDVSNQEMTQMGAVSEAVAKQMAEGARNLYETDFAVSSTGVAGPTGGTPEKPVGTVWIGIAGPERTFALRFHMGENRERNIAKTALQALQLLRKEVIRQAKISETESLYLKE